MSYKKIELSKKVSHEHSDIIHYRDFMEHELFNYNETKPTNFDQFLFFMSIGILFGDELALEDAWNNVTAGKSAREEHISLITAISYSNNDTKNFNKPSAIAKEAEQFAKGGLHRTLKELNDAGIDSFLKSISVEMVRRAALLKKDFDVRRAVDQIEDE